MGLFALSLCEVPQIQNNEETTGNRGTRVFEAYFTPLQAQPLAKCLKVTMVESMPEMQYVSGRDFNVAGKFRGDVNSARLGFYICGKFSFPAKPFFFLF